MGMSSEGPRRILLLRWGAFRLNGADLERFRGAPQYGNDTLNEPRISFSEIAVDPSIASRSSGAASVHFSLEMDVYPETRRGGRIEPVPAQVGKWIPAAARPRISGSGAGMINEAPAQQPVIPVEAGIQKKAWLVKRIIPRNIAFPAVLYSVVTWTVYPLGLAGSWDGSSGLQGAGSRRSQPITPCCPW